MRARVEKRSVLGWNKSVDIPPGSKVRYPDLVVPPLQAILAVPTSGSCSKFSPSPYETCPTSTSLATLAMALYGA